MIDKKKISFTLLASILLLGAGCVGNLQNKDSSPEIKDKIEVSDEIAKNNNGFINKENDILYRMSSGSVAVIAPAGWSISQADMGGMSVVVLKNSDNEQVLIRVELAYSFETNALIDYADWLEGHELSGATDSKKIDNKILDVYVSEYAVIYTGGLYEANKDFFLRIGIPVDASDDVQKILDSILITPDTSEIENAVIIP